MRRSPSKHLHKFLAGGDLAGQQEGADQFALTADGHAREPLEPLAVRHLRFGMKPVGQQPKLIGGNVSAGDSVEQMVKQARRQTVAADARHGYSP